MSECLQTKLLTSVIVYITQRHWDYLFDLKTIKDHKKQERKVNTWPNAMFPSQQRRCSYVDSGCWGENSGKEYHLLTGCDFFFWCKQIVLTLSVARYWVKPLVGCPFHVRSCCALRGGILFPKPARLAFCENISVKQSGHIWCQILFDVWKKWH